MRIASLKSKLAQKIFIFFITASLVPLLIGTIISYYQVSTIVKEDSLKKLQNATSEYGLLLFSRLKIASDTLYNNSQNFIDDNNNLENTGINNVNSFFSGVAIANKKIIFGEIHESILFEKSVISRDKQLYTVKLDEGKYDIYLVFKNGIIGKIKPNFFWASDTVDTEIQFCVANNNFIRLHCQQTISENSFKRLMKLDNEKDTNKSIFDQSEYQKLHTIWDLFLDYEFGVKNWKIISTQKSGVGNQRLLDFTAFYIPLIIFTLFLVVLLSSVLIRRNLSTINDLIAGTKQIIGGNYKHTIAIKSDDELGQLARSFNIMADNMGMVVKEYKAFSDIDQFILESVSKDDVVNSVLSRLKEIVSFTHIKLVNKIDNSLKLLQYYQFPTETETEIQEGLRPLRKSDASYKKINNFLLDGLTVFNRSELYSIPSELGHSTNADYFCIIPIAIGKNEKSYIVASFNNTKLSDLEKEKIKVFVSRIEIAFQALEREESLRYLANHDYLTALPNKNKLLSHYDDRQFRNYSPNTCSALLFIDLDNFKHVNDNYGHIVGDKLLQTLATLFKSCLSHDDIAARIGGDEFVVITQHDNKQALDKQLPILCNNIIKHATTPHTIDNHLLHIGASIGVFIDQAYENEFDDAIRYADIAMYFSKKNGGNQFCVYEQSMSDELFKRSLLERDLRIALENEEFEVYYQVKVKSDTRETTSFEALFRWNHSQYGPISPFIAIDIAESIGIIGQLGRAVFIRSVGQYQYWLEQGYQVDSIAINVSPMQLMEADFIDFITKTINSLSLVDFSMVELEITESVMLNNKQESLDVLNNLKDLGLRIAIDDFGTGYSSLSYLLDIPATTLKIDRAFVIKIEQDPNALSLLRSLISLGKSMAYKIVAEGVETEQQAEFLMDSGADELQGYLFSKPLPAELAEKRFLIPSALKKENRFKKIN